MDYSYQITIICNKGFNVLKIEQIEWVWRNLGNVLSFSFYFGVVVKKYMIFEPNSPVFLITNILSNMEVR